MEVSCPSIGRAFSSARAHRVFAGDPMIGGLSKNGLRGLNMNFQLPQGSGRTCGQRTTQRVYKTLGMPNWASLHIDSNSSSVIFSTENSGSLSISMFGGIGITPSSVPPCDSLFDANPECPSEYISIFLVSYRCSSSSLSKRIGSFILLSNRSWGIPPATYNASREIQRNSSRNDINSRPSLRLGSGLADSGQRNGRPHASFIA